jgi:hypothetical protein
MNKFISPGKVKQVNATILAPELAGLRLVLNACGQNGKFESQLATVLTKKWAKVREDYKGWYASQHNFKMGAINTTAVSSDTWVVNLLVEDKEGKVDPVVLETAVKKVADLAHYEHASVHISNLLVNQLPTIQPLLTKYLVETGTNVFFYNEPTK